MPLTYIDRGAARSGTQFDAMSHGLRIGYVGKEVLSSVAGSEQLWRWTLYVSAAPQGLERHGHASSLEEARSALEQNWSRWLVAAGLIERP